MHKALKNLYFFSIIVLTLGWFLPTPVFAINTVSTTSGVIKITTTDDAPSSPRTLKPSSTIHMNFALENTNYPGQAFTCGSGKKLFFILKHWSGSTYEFTNTKQSQAVDYTFNSGNAGQQNKYQAVFYCNADYLPGIQASVFQTNLNNLKNSTGQVWEGNVWDNTTGAMPTVSFSPTKAVYQAGDVITVKIDNLPVEASTATVTVNSKSNPAPALVSGPKSYPLTIGTADGFVAEGNNTITISIKDTSGSAVVLGNSSFTVQSGPVAVAGTPGAGTSTPGTGGGTGGGTTTGVSPLSNCTKEQADANECLYNPLPEGNLTKMFLLMTKGFLTIMGVWGVMFIIVGGFRLVLAAGNEEQYIAAKKTITWAILGVVIAIMSFSIIAIVQNFVTDKEIMKVNTSN